MILVAISIVVFVSGLLDLKSLFATIIGESIVAYLVYWLLKKHKEPPPPKLIINCFISKEKEQVGFELEGDQKLTKVEVYALVEGIDYGRIGLPYTNMGVLNYHFATLYRGKIKRFLLAGKAPKQPNDKATYYQLNKITPMILDGRSHRITVTIKCNEIQEEKIKYYHLQFNSWDEIVFSEIRY